MHQADRHMHASTPRTVKGPLLQSGRDGPDLHALVYPPFPQEGKGLFIGVAPDFAQVLRVCCLN